MLLSHRVRLQELDLRKLAYSTSLAITYLRYHVALIAAFSFLLCNIPPDPDYWCWITQGQFSAQHSHRSQHWLALGHLIDLAAQHGP